MQLDYQSIASSSLLFESLGDVLFCVKDLEGRYTQVNPAFIARVGLRNRSEAIGKTAEHLFPEALAEAFSGQDSIVIETGRALTDRLERITNEDGSVGWYLSHKFPLHDIAGKIVGIAGHSQDLRTPAANTLQLAELADVVRHIEANLDQPLRVEELAGQAGLTTAQFERRMKRIFRLSPKQFITKARIEAATQLLEETEMSIGDIAIECGFSDQSAFTRQFRTTTGATPGAFRSRFRMSA